MRSRSILLTVAAVLISAGTSTAQTPTSNHSDVSRSAILKFESYQAALSSL